MPGGAITTVEFEPATLPRRHRRTTPDQDVQYDKPLKAPVKHYSAVGGHEESTSLPARPPRSKIPGGLTYYRIAELLREEIRAAEWKPSDRLPSHSELADQIRVSLSLPATLSRYLSPKIWSTKLLPAERWSEIKKY
ncbi:GntR family transcriptional regulator [Nocardia sp. NPDC023852]|uniref:GntR family transcriptional regulator n=1 Tax=Nocardia sp. NPDC023852 TaxID=3154697 RepID=UPI0033D8CF8B